MTFKEACELTKKMDFNKFYNRYDPNMSHILMGCEGRFIRKPNWPDNVFIINKNLLYKIKKFERVAWDNVPEFINIGKAIYGSKKDDWIVEDRIPGQTIIINDGIGYWG